MKISVQEKIAELGYAPDEEGFSPTTCEGYWSHTFCRWVSVLDPKWPDLPQPTHWMPLPAPPRASVPAAQEKT